MYALREEDDILENQTGRWPRYFYPRPPRGGRPSWTTVYQHWNAILSTPSAWWATTLDDRFSALERISIHALREEGDVQPPEAGGAAVVISIHALREEGDLH